MSDHHAGPLSLQLWSTRGDDPLPRQLDYLVAHGFTDVQPFHDQYDDVGALKDMLATAGLSTLSGHFNIAMFDGDARRVIDAARALDMSLVVAPWLEPEDRPTDKDGWRRIHDWLIGVKARIEDAGFAFAWHNHDFEFQRFEDGSFGIEYLLGEEIDVAFDLAWVHVAGEDPATWLRRYAGRVPAVHVKDVAASGENIDEMGFADLGHGVVDWPALWNVLDELDVGLRIVEHDQPSDWRRFVTRTTATMRRLRGEAPFAD